jgi:hypothetical protein
MVDMGKIKDRCPTCGNDTLFISDGGWLTCSWLECKQPGVGRRIEQLLTIEKRVADIDAKLAAAGRADAYQCCRPALFARAGRTTRHDQNGGCDVTSIATRHGIGSGRTITRAAQRWTSALSEYVERRTVHRDSLSRCVDECDAAHVQCRHRLKTNT